MIRQQFQLDRASGWRVTAYYAVTHYEVDEIMTALERAGCRGEHLQSAYDNLSSGNQNTGLCYSGDGESVLVVSVASSGKEFSNSIFHEVAHLSCHIATALGIDLRGEEVCYLAGEIGQKMHPIIAHYLCEDCRGH